MTKVFYQSSVLQNMIFPAVETSFKYVNSAFLEADKISFPRDLGFKEIVHDLSTFSINHKDFLNWTQRCSASLNRKVVEHEQIVHLLPVPEIEKRNLLVK